MLERKPRPISGLDCFEGAMVEVYMGHIRGHVHHNAVELESDKLLVVVTLIYRSTSRIRKRTP
jgi:hypothetical protein